MMVPLSEVKYKTGIMNENAGIFPQTLGDVGDGNVHVRTALQRGLKVIQAFRI